MEGDAVRRLIYRSQAADGFDLQALLAMLVTARESNAVRRVTGLLVHQRGRFLQAIEGATADIEALWQAIQRDPRHFDVELLADSDLGQRWFGDWSMELADADSLPGRFAGAWTEALTQPLEQVDSAESAEALLRAFADNPPR